MYVGGVGSRPRARANRLRPQQAQAQAVGPDLLYCSARGWVAVLGIGGLTSHSSRRRFAARLNSGVRPLKSKAVWSRFNPGVAGSARYLKLRLVCHRAIEFLTGCPSFGQAKRSIGCAALEEGAASASPRPDSSGAARPVRLASAPFQAKILRAGHSSRMLRPNNSFKPTPLRYASHMAGKACHVFAPLRSAA